MSYPCPVSTCNRVLSSRHSLKRHIECSHQNIKRFECQICFKTFTSSQNLREHQFLHRRDEITEFMAPISSKNVDIEIPMLTSLVMETEDPDLRPLCCIDLKFPYPGAAIPGNFREFERIDNALGC